MKTDEDRTVYAVRNEQGLWYNNRNSGSTRWVTFDMAQIFSKKGAASAAARRSNGAWETPATRNIPAEVVPFLLVEVPG